MDMFSNNNNNSGSNNKNKKGHSRTNSGMSFLLSASNSKHGGGGGGGGGGHSRAASRIDDGALSAATSTTSIQVGGPSPGSRHTAQAGLGGGGEPGMGAAKNVPAPTAAAVTATTAGGSGQRQHRRQAGQPTSKNPRQLEEGVPSLDVASQSPPLGASGGHRSAARAQGAAASRPSMGGVPYPETPPPLRGAERRASLVGHDVVEDDPKERIAPELMIGEIQVPLHTWWIVCVV